jgi:hypothetical protein
MTTNSSATKNTTIVRKVSKFLDVTVDDSLANGIGFLGTFYEPPGGITATSERKPGHMRSGIEQGSLALHRTFLQEFSVVNSEFTRVAALVDDLVRSCEAVTGALRMGREEGQQLLSHVRVLQTDLKDVTTREAQVKSFLEKYQLTPEEKAVLAGDVNTTFFDVLRKVRTIHESCKELLSMSHQQAGIEIMESMYVVQVSALERVHKYAINSIQTVLAQDTAEVPTHLVTALKELRERPALWSKAMEEIVRIRRTVVVRMFFDALTRGACPIEMQSHDAVRYVGDVLAWAHQSVAEEMELLSVFYRDANDANPLETSPKDLLDSIYEALCKHIKVRIDQSIEGTHTAVPQGQYLVTMFRLEHLMAFYSQTLSVIMGNNASLVLMLADCKLHLSKLFYDALKVLCDKLTSMQIVAPVDLSVPPVIQDALGKLRHMLDTVAASLIPQSDREKEFSVILNAIVDPLLTLSSLLSGDMERPARMVLQINTLCAVHALLAQYDFTSTKVAKVHQCLDRDITLYVNSQVDTLRRFFGFDDKLEQLRNQEPKVALSSYATTHPSVMRDTMQAFITHVYRTGSIAVPFADKLNVVKVRELAQASVAAQVCTTYNILYDAVHSPTNEYPDPVSIAQHNPAQIRTLLDVAP